jgi:hypothetical protein
MTDSPMATPRTLYEMQCETTPSLRSHAPTMQLIYGPYIVGTCLALATALKDPTIAAVSVPARLREDYLPTLAASYCVW